MRIDGTSLTFQSSNVRVRETRFDSQRMNEEETRQEMAKEGQTLGLVRSVSETDQYAWEQVRFEKEVVAQTLERVKTFTQALEKETETVQRQRIVNPMSARDGEVTGFAVTGLVTEEEQTRFRVEGTIATASGEEIELSIRLKLSSSYRRETDALIAGTFKDPLVINYAAPSAALSSNTFRLDIDNDGREDQISLLKKGSGFLAYDANGDGVINDGSELFGGTTGKGFEELARFDDDGNGWIDENDAIFKGLRVWSKTDEEDRLIALGEVGVGAIYLGSEETPFALKDENNKTLGMVRQSGLFLKENGDAGLIQQVDLADHSPVRILLSANPEGEIRVEEAEWNDLVAWTGAPASSIFLIGSGEGTLEEESRTVETLQEFTEETERIRETEATAEESAEEEETAYAPIQATSPVDEEPVAPIQHTGKNTGYEAAQLATQAGSGKNVQALSRKQAALTQELSRLEARFSKSGDDPQLESRILQVRRNVQALETQMLLINSVRLDLNA